MQFAQIATLLAVAIGASATAVPRGDSGSSWTLCAEPPSGKCDIKTSDKCKSGGGTPYSCIISPTLVGILQCTNILTNNVVNVDILKSVSIGDISLPITL